jgi:hypothetical protein
MAMKKGKGRSSPMGTGKKRGRPSNAELERRRLAAERTVGKSAAPEVNAPIAANRSIPSKETIAKINDRDRSSYAREPALNDKGQVVIHGYISAAARDYWKDPSWTVMKARDARQLTRPSRNRVQPDIQWDDRDVPTVVEQPAAAASGSMGTYIPSQTELTFMANTIADKFIGWFEKKYGPRLAQNIVSTLQEGVIAALNTGRERSPPSHVAPPSAAVGAPVAAPVPGIAQPNVASQPQQQLAPPPQAAAAAVDRQPGGSH